VYELLSKLNQSTLDHTSVQQSIILNPFVCYSTNINVSKWYRTRF